MSSRAEKRRDRRKGGGEGGGGSSSRLGLILGIAGAVAVVVVGWNVFSSLTDSTARSSVELDYDSPEELIAMAQGISAGNPNAPVTVMEFGDYQCPACQNFFRQAKPILDVSYIEPGRIEFVYYDFPLEQSHPNAFVAARAARCAGEQDAYWPFHDTLFQNQLSWAGQADPVSDFVRYAGDLGLDRDAFRACVRSDRYADVVSANLQLAIQLGATSTPTVIIDAGGGQVIPVSDWGTSLRPTLEQLLAEATPATSPADANSEESDADEDAQ